MLGRTIRWRKHHWNNTYRRKRIFLYIHNNYFNVPRQEHNNILDLSTKDGFQGPK